MVVQVKNDGSGLTAVNVAFQTADGTAKAANPVFVNHYSADSDLTITNTVTGTYADLTRQFTYKLTLNAAGGVTTTDTYSAQITRKNGTVEAAFTVGYSANADIKLADGDVVVISGLPVGTTYALQQVGESTYKPAVNVTINAAAPVNEAVSTDGASLTIGAAGDGAVTLTTPISIGKKTNIAAWANVYPDPPTPTGILIDTLPYLLLVLAGVGGLVAFIVVKRRRSH
ncbi:MAG: hypothetical protein ACK5LX_04495 [Oscillospiraceae bacterium]